MSFSGELWFSLFVKIAAAIVAPILIAIVFALFRHAYRARQALSLARAALKSVERETHDGVTTEGPGFWLRRPIKPPANYSDLAGSSIPVLMIAATKGGVGKTSLAGSLAAHFAMRWRQERETPGALKPLRVLVIDQDFQGSFTTMTVDINRRYVLPSKSNRLVSGELDGGKIVEVAEAITQPGMKHGLSIWTIPAYYDLAQAENRMLVNWLLPISDEGLANRLLRLLGLSRSPGEQRGIDIRYLLAKSLLQPGVQKRFDLVIIDSPPRLTTSHMQAMCAATHVLIPTVVDGLSGDAVARYLDQLAVHKLGPDGAKHLAICPYLQPIGVACTMVPTNIGGMDGRRNLLAQRIEAARLKPPLVPMDCMIRIRSPYREHAGELIAYAALRDDQAHRELRSEVDLLGQWVAERLGSTGRGWRYS